MNIFQIRGYKPSSLDGPRQRLALCDDLQRSIIERPLTAADTLALLANELDRARLANAFGHTDTLQKAISTGAAMAAAAAMREYLVGGRVNVSLEDGLRFSFPDGSTGLTPPFWIDGLSLAVLADNRDALRCLADPRVLEAVIASAASNMTLVGTETFWAEYGHAFLALLAGDPGAEVDAQKAIASIAAGLTGAMDPRGLEATDRFVLEIIHILASEALTQWPQAVQRAIEAFHSYFTEPQTAHLLPGYLPLALAAVCRIAVGRGFEHPPKSPYLPLNLLNNASAGCGGTLLFEFDRRSVISADEAHWFLDLQGFPRAGRSHRLMDSNGQLVVRHEVHGAPAIPHAAIEFAIVEQNEIIAAAKREIDPPALDAGELLFLAEAFANQPSANRDPNSLRRQRMLLADAVACVDSVLCRIPNGFDAVDGDSIASKEGRRLFQREPGRFRSDRLTAYRNGLMSQLTMIDEEIGGASETSQYGEGVAMSSEHPTKNDTKARLEASAAIEVIQNQAMPLLQEIGRDFNGEFIASLQPRDDDFEKVFLGDTAELARKAYRNLWAGKMRIPFPSSAQTEIRCATAPAGMLKSANALSRQFPGGYRSIAPVLNPHRVWIAWKYLAPGTQSGLSLDGLVWVDDHWAWFPKPYRFLGFSRK